MLQKNRGESGVSEMEKASKIKDWDFPRVHYFEGGERMYLGKMIVYRESIENAFLL